MRGVGPTQRNGRLPPFPGRQGDSLAPESGRRAQLPEADLTRFDPLPTIGQSRIVTAEAFMNFEIFRKFSKFFSFRKALWFHWRDQGRA
jgi:hypothetical protein